MFKNLRLGDKLIMENGNEIMINEHGGFHVSKDGILYVYTLVGYYSGICRYGSVPYGKVVDVIRISDELHELYKRNLGLK